MTGVTRCSRNDGRGSVALGITVQSSRVKRGTCFDVMRKEAGSSHIKRCARNDKLKQRWYACVTEYCIIALSKEAGSSHVKRFVAGRCIHRSSISTGIPITNSAPRQMNPKMVPNRQNNAEGRYPLS